MEPIALFIRVRVRSGKRDQAQQLWEKHLKNRAESNQAQDMYCYCYDEKDKDVILIFERYLDRGALNDNARQKWFQGYMNDVGPLLDGAPEVSVGLPIWTKGKSNDA